MSAENNPNEINFTREYDAPVNAVWDAWTDPEQAAKWWGPRGFTTTTLSKELKVGGFWNYTMHGPDGIDYPNKTQYLQVDRYKRLVYDQGGNEGPPMFRVTVLFSESNGKTKMEMSMAFPTAEIAKESHKFIKKAGGHTTWDRLAEYLNKKLLGKESFVIYRSFNASIEQMYQMWTDPKHFSKWLAPTGFTMEFIREEIRSGGTSFYFMKGPDVSKMYGRVQYIELQKPNRLVYTQQFCDEREQISRHPMSPTWPQTMLTTVLFSVESPEDTRVTVTWACHGDVTPEELATFIQGRAGMTGGWTGSFDKLEEYIGL